MRVLVWSSLLAWPAWAHVVSMSSGDLTIDGTRAHYELRMPLYEIAHVPSPERVLLEHIRFSSAGRDARLLAKSCRAEAARDTFVCTADYEFAAPVERLDVECTFAAITVPNHVHLLRAEMAGKRDQGLFDISFPRATLRFRPPTPLETAVTESGAGFMRALGGVVQILFLAALALAARSGKELAALSGMFLAGQIVSVLVVPHTAWQPAPRFVEAAAALTIAYLAVEILLLPQAGARWLVAGVLGAFHGLYFHLFLQTTGYRAGFVLAGAAFAEIIVVALLPLAFSRIGRVARALRPVQVAASALLIFGMAWFFLRLRS
ncbi:MAG: HupE/UreJ family protein [Acidobacteriia bacterium]|nr:HupE/UreJ family protein [Terriglobia bacterium]